jgi:hypothetical protein
MEVAGGSTSDWATVWQWECNGTGAQRVTLTSAGGGYYLLVFDHSGKCLDVAWGGTANGDDLIQYDCTGEPHSMQWALVATGSPHPYRLQNRNSGKCVDVQYQSLSQGEILHQWTCGSQDSQKWNNWP